jgi:hypothetical protein
MIILFLRLKMAKIINFNKKKVYTYELSDDDEEFLDGLRYYVSTNPRAFIRKHIDFRFIQVIADDCHDVIKNVEEFKQYFVYSGCLPIDIITNPFLFIVYAHYTNERYINKIKIVADVKQNWVKKTGIRI